PTGWHASCNQILNPYTSKDRTTMPEQTVTDQEYRFATGRLRQQFRNHSGRIRDMIRKDIQDIPGLMALLMKPRNGSRWTPAERAELVGQLRGISRLGLFLALAVVPGSMVALPLLAWWLDRRRTQVPHVADRRATNSAQKKDIKVERAVTEQHR
ncbi:MAG: hypothetical protein AABZ50_05760, partial [Pseudomonadota bacterium]